MKLNLKFYNEKDKYSDGDIEDTIIELIKKYPDNYETAFKENSSWPVLYHLSNTRKNVISWYPFKEESSILEIGAGMGAITEELCRLCKSVTSIELSKRRATAILERNKDANNLEIIVGNFKNVKLTEKYDYILLNGVLEYAALYMNTKNPYEDFISKLKNNLKSDGKILVAIENKTGLKYWCGANEDHTGVMFDGLNNYANNRSIRTFSKYELEKLAKNVNMHINFYYMFPDYKFPKIVLTDKFLDKNIYVDYSPYYCNKMNTILNESSLYKEIYKNHMIPFFANSYFLELSNKPEKIEVEFAKFNSEYRKEQYNLCTYLKNNKYYKKALGDKGQEHLKRILEINDYIEKKGVSIVGVHKENETIYTKSTDGVCLIDIIKNLYNEEKFDSIEKCFDDIYKIVKKISGKKVGNENNIFDKYGITDYPDNLEYYEHGIIDIIPNNIIIKDNKKYLIDQEWMEDNVPLEYIMFRAINNAFNQIDNNSELRFKLYKKYNIVEELYSELEEKFLSNVCNEFHPFFVNLINNYTYQGNINYLVDQTNNIPNLLNNIKQLEEDKMMIEEEKKGIVEEKNKIEKEKDKITEEKDEINNKYNSIVNSKRWKIINRIANIFHR